MAAPRRTAFEIERDKTMLTQMYLRGATQQEIANELTARRRKERYGDTPDLLMTPEQIEDVTFSRNMVQYDLAQVRLEWKESRVQEMDSQRTVELEKLDNLEKAAWEAYDRSMGQKKKTSQTAAPGDDGQLVAQRVSGTTEEMIGDPKFMVIIYQCIDRRCRLLGLDPPQQRIGGNKEDEGNLNGELVNAGDTVLAKLAKQRAAREASRDFIDLGQHGEGGAPVPVGVLGPPESAVPEGS